MPHPDDTHDERVAMRDQLNRECHAFERAHRKTLSLEDFIEIRDIFMYAFGLLGVLDCREDPNIVHMAVHRQKEVVLGRLKAGPEDVVFKGSEATNFPLPPLPTRYVTEGADTDERDWKPAGIVQKEDPRPVTIPANAVVYENMTIFYRDPPPANDEIPEENLVEDSDPKDESLEDNGADDNTLEVTGPEGNHLEDNNADGTDSDAGSVDSLLFPSHKDTIHVYTPAKQQNTSKKRARAESESKKSSSGHSTSSPESSAETSDIYKPASRLRKRLRSTDDDAIRHLRGKTVTAPSSGHYNMPRRNKRATKGKGVAAPPKASSWSKVQGRWKASEGTATGTLPTGTGNVEEKMADMGRLSNGVQLFNVLPFNPRNKALPKSKATI